VQAYFDQFHPEEPSTDTGGSMLRFYLLDTSENTLPLPYDFPFLPALGFFPAHEPNRSSVFPTEELGITVPNLMAFLTPKLQPALRWTMAEQLCRSGTCLRRNLAAITQYIDEKGVEIRDLRRLLHRRKHPTTAIVGTEQPQQHTLLPYHLRRMIGKRVGERRRALALHSLLLGMAEEGSGGRREDLA